jgi:2'-5' RNA ligase
MRCGDISCSRRTREGAGRRVVEGPARKKMRLFVALDFPDDVRRALGDLMAKLKPLSADARWVRPEGMHVTLKFIGHAVPTGDTEKLDEVRAALATVRSDRPVEMNFRGMGFFPNASRPRVIWCGVHASENLAPLAADVDKVLEPPGISREDRAFVPHLTLARFKPTRSGRRSHLNRTSGEPLRSAAAEMSQNDFGSACETEFHLFESIMKRSGAEYRKLQTYSFVRAAE